MAWNYLKQKPVSTPDVNKNNKPVKTSGDKKDTNSVTGTRAARPQKPVTSVSYTHLTLPPIYSV